MSNAIVTPAPVYLTKGFSDSFKGFPLEKLENIARGLVPFEDSETVKPSCIKMNKANYATGLGAKASPVSILTSLLWGVAAYAHGQQKLESLQQGLPSLSQFAIVAACSTLKAGGGINAATLRRAALLGIEKTLGLGFKPKAEKVLSAPASAPASAPTSAPVFMGNESASMPSLASIQANERAHDALWSAYGDALAVTFKENSKPGFVESFASWAESHEDQALDALRIMAESLGYRLTKKAKAKA